MELGMIWISIITAMVALYGAVLSTCNSIHRRRETRRQIKVRLSMGFITQMGGVSPSMLLIEASNPGNRPVTLNGPGILLPNRMQLIFPFPLSNVQFPYELQEGKSCTVWKEAKDLAQSLKEERGLSSKVKIVGFYRDALGTTYSSKPLKFDVDKWAKNKP